MEIPLFVVIRQVCNKGRVCVSDSKDNLVLSASVLVAHNWKDEAEDKDKSWSHGSCANNDTDAVIDRSSASKSPCVEGSD